MKPASTPAIAVVAATKDRPARLRSLISSLRRQTLDDDRFEIVIVDDGSGPETAELLAEEATDVAPRVRWIRRERSGGPAAARNDGWRSTAAPLVAFTDDDCVASPDWLERLLAAANEPGVIVQGRTTPIPDELEQEGLFTRTIRSEELGPFFQTCNILYPRETLEQLEGFDERLMFVEDADLAWRALETGAEVRFEPQALVHHAVENLGPIGLLRVALRWTDMPYVLGRHRGLRARTRWHRVFWKRSHSLLAQALLGLAFSRRVRPALLIAVPYVWDGAKRCSAVGASPVMVPYLVVHDLCEAWSAIRGGVKHGVMVL